jgi:hypothetical protein
LKSDKDWRCQKYGPLGLIETLLKVGSMIVMIASISQYDPDASRLDVISITKVVLIVVTAVLAVVHALLIPLRLLEREICAICFMICHALAHIIVPVILVTSGDPTQFVFTWAALCLFGDLIKFAFLKIEDEFEVYLLTRQVSSTRLSLSVPHSPPFPATVCTHWRDVLPVFCLFGACCDHVDRRLRRCLRMPAAQHSRE